MLFILKLNHEEHLCDVITLQRLSQPRGWPLSLPFPMVHLAPCQPHGRNSLQEAGTTHQPAGGRRCLWAAVGSSATRARGRYLPCNCNWTGAPPLQCTARPGCHNSTRELEPGNFAQELSARISKANGTRSCAGQNPARKSRAKIPRGDVTQGVYGEILLRSGMPKPSSERLSAGEAADELGRIKAGLFGRMRPTQ